MTTPIPKEIKAMADVGGFARERRCSPPHRQRRSGSAYRQVELLGCPRGVSADAPARRGLPLRSGMVARQLFLCVQLQVVEMSTVSPHWACPLTDGTALRVISVKSKVCLRAEVRWLMSLPWESAGGYGDGWARSDPFRKISRYPLHAIRTPGLRALAGRPMRKQVHLAPCARSR